MPPGEPVIPDKEIKKDFLNFRGNSFMLIVFCKADDFLFLLSVYKGLSLKNIPLYVFLKLRKAFAFFNRLKGRNIVTCPSEALRSKKKKN